MTFGISKILIIRLSSIGDIVLASPLIRVLRTSFPKAQIDFLVKREYADLVRYNQHLSSIIELDTGKGFSHLRQLRQRIKPEKYDIIFDIQNNFRSIFLRSFSGARYLRVVNKRAIARFMLVTFKWNVYRRIVSVAERYLEAARELGVTNDGKGLEIFIPDETLFSVSSMMGKYRLDKSDAVLGIAPAANHNTKMWPQDRFAEVAVHTARENNAKVFLFGGPEDVDRCEEIADRVNSTLGTEAAVSFAGKISLLETAAALDFCDALLCNDTGLMHLAAARQRSIVALFGPTVAEFGFYPYGTAATVLDHNDLRCRPCTPVGSARCPKGHFRCMVDTCVEDVIRALTPRLHRGTPMLTHQHRSHQNHHASM